MSIVTIITDPGVGGTFLTWSLEWLSGKQSYFSVKNNSWLGVCNNPLTTINAHAFLPNQPKTLDQLQSCYDRLADYPNPHKHFVYFHNFCDDENSYIVDPGQDASAVQLAREHSQRCLVLGLSSQNVLYHCKQTGRSLPGNCHLSVMNKSSEEQNQDYINCFFGHDQALWNSELKLDEIWDRREFLALNMRPFSMTVFDKSLFHHLNCMALAAEDCFFYLDSIMDQIFHYIDTPIDKSRWQHWNNIYKRWQKLHQDRMRFCWYFDQIIKAIIDDVYLDLSRFDLDLYREAAIQHVLLYRHNLNLRTHGLAKFTDTHQLHTKLEPNIYHRLAQIY